MRKINLLVVHCSATAPALDIGVREIRQWHLKRGWSDIGYHYVIRRDGSLETGRPLEKAGAHAKGHNASSVGICLAGGVDTANTPENNFTDAQFASLRTLLVELLQRFPQSRICGHRDLSNVRKACPCFDVAQWWAQNEPGSGSPAEPAANEAETDLDVLIAQAAARHELPPELVAAMVRVESGGDPWAIRYEQGFYRRYIAERGLPHFSPCSQETEDRTRAMSFGLLQLMGQVARELGCDLPFLAQLCDPATGLEWSCRYLTRLRRSLRKTHGTTSWECVCAAYNGGPGVVTGAGAHSNAPYVNKVSEQLGGHWPQ